MAAYHSESQTDPVRPSQKRARSWLPIKFRDEQASGFVKFEP